MTLRFFICLSLAGLADTCVAQPIRLMTLDPGHFHAALVQKSMYPGVDSIVYVYAPPGPDVQFHLDRINAYNTRSANPTHWVERTYTGAGYLQKMITDKPGNTVVLAGNNRDKTHYIMESLRAGFDVLGDKPMVIDDRAFGLLKQAFDTAAAHHRILYDIMTERYEITSILQRELARIPGIFGALEKGSPAHPGFVAEGVHRWYKYVSGSVVTRPPWFFDVSQQGEGIVDVMTHLVDLAQWECFPDRVLDYTRDIQVDRARHWTTDLTRSQFGAVTGLDDFPPYLQKDLRHDSVLKVYANGEIDYRLRGVYVRTITTWTYKAPPGADDTYSSVLRGSKADLIIRQDSAQQYHSTLYIEPVSPDPSYIRTLDSQFKTLEVKYPGIALQPAARGWVVVIPDKYKEGHEAHFARVTEKFLGYLRQRALPSWEVPGMLAKYYTTTQALKLARAGDPAAGPDDSPASRGMTTPVSAMADDAALASDTLTATVAEWDKLIAEPTPYGDRRQVLKGSTRDLSRLDVRAYTLFPGKSFTPPQETPLDHLLIIRQGRVIVTAGANHKELGPGGVGLFAAGEEPALLNTGTVNVSFYLFSFASKGVIDMDRAGKTGGPLLIDWPEIPMKKTGKGETRPIFSRPEAWLGTIDMHATTLNPGEISHPQHMHRNEEIILMRSGQVRMHIADGYRDAASGDLVFLPSGVPHDLENGKTGPCEYFALQWQQ